ncbi:unnamed protein product [Auanema sp. JU1783]|nr:unnamed protein product [Auanema sp. JU1783]
MEYPDSLPIHMLNHDTMSQLCNILDAHDVWEELISHMPEISMIDVDGCKKFKAEGSPSWYLLRIWGSKGYTIADLYTVFALAKLLRCMKIIRSHVPNKYHHIEDSLISSGSISKSLLAPSTDYKSDFTLPKISEVTNSLSSLSGLKETQSEIKNTSTSGSSSTEDSLLVALQNTLSVTYEELELATNKFSPENILGKGGYGVVYKGEWKQMNIAVKRINATVDKGVRYEKERVRQSLQELRTLAKYRHENILPLYAFCLESEEPCLVYMYMANGSLEDRLLCKRGTTALTWQQRWNIAEGTARGLLYLHTTDKNPIIHGDVKSANILLDKHLEPKIGDFGLSRDGQVEVASDEKSPLIASHIKGTLAYLPPDYGIVLLEMATGLRAYAENRKPYILLDYVYEIQSSIVRGKGNLREKMKDTLMDKKQFCFSNDSKDTFSFHELLKLGMWCSQKERSTRPSFQEVTSMLPTILAKADRN